VGNEVRTITKLFQNTEISIAYKTKNTIQHHLQSKENNDPDKYDHSGVYETSCRNCNLKYVGQTGRIFRIRYTIYGNKTTSRYVQHILDTGHSYGSIKDTLRILHRNKKGLMMNTLEQFHMHGLTREYLQLNDTHTDTYNLIFNLISTYNI
jgi:hypothetical protein